MPERIQLQRKRGWRMPPNTLKVDRSTRWGNPMIADIKYTLAGRNLACWCRIGQPCHADVLLEIANQK
jgi:hypothetical protein